MDNSKYSHLLAPLDLGFTEVKKPGSHGLDAHRARGSAGGL